MLDSKITSKGQTTIPQDIRILLGIEPGDRIVYEPGKNGVTIRKQKRYTFSDLRGLLPKPAVRLTIEEMNQAIGEAVAKRNARSMPKRKPKK